MNESFSTDAWYRALSSHDLAQLRPFLSAECRYEDVPTGTVSEGPDAVAAFFQRTWSAFPDMEMRPGRVLQTENGAAAEWIMTGTHSGDFPGLPATGNTLHVRGVSFIELEGGRVRRVSDYWDLATSGLLGGAAQAEPAQPEEMSKMVGDAPRS